jgi:hypothetical protein
MSDELALEQWLRLLSEFRSDRRKARRLNRTQYAVRSESWPDDDHVVELDPMSLFPVRCSGVGDEGRDCRAFTFRGLCQHSVGAAAQARKDEQKHLDEAPPPSHRETLEQATPIEMPHGFRVTDYTDPHRALRLAQDAQEAWVQAEGSHGRAREAHVDVWRRLKEQMEELETDEAREARTGALHRRLFRAAS